MDGSLERLYRPQGVNVFFAHRPDLATPLEEQIALGHAKEWGVANHPPESLQKIIDLCEQKDWVKPTWYQGTYNLLTRGMETRVLPILHAHGMSFLASHALASGYLTCNHIDTDGQPTGRFAKNSNYAVPEVAVAMRDFLRACRAHALPPVEVASRWVAHHSALGGNDGIVVGASRLAQVGDTVANIRRGALPEEVVVLVDGIWDAVKHARGSMI